MIKSQEYCFLTHSVHKMWLEYHQHSTHFNYASPASLQVQHRLSICSLDIFSGHAVESSDSDVYPITVFYATTEMSPAIQLETS